MKKLLLLLLCVPLIGLGQTLIPDANFEQALINLGYDTGAPNGSVPTSSIDTVTSLDLISLNISDLTGIEDFTALTYLDCSFNQLTILDVSSNTALTYLFCGDNQLTNLDVRNGNNQNIFPVWFNTEDNPNLTCISVDDSTWSANNWTNIDPQHYFSNNCGGSTAIEEQTTNKELLKVTDILGRESDKKRNTPLFYIYNDGTVEKKIIIE